LWPNLALEAEVLKRPLLSAFQTIAPHNGIAPIDPKQTSLISPSERKIGGLKSDRAIPLGQTGKAEP